MFVNLARRKVLVAGGGKVALRKVQALKEFGAEISVVAPDILPEFSALAGLCLAKRKFRPEDLAGCVLAIAATDSPDENARIARECRRRKIPVNAVDEPENCDFYFPATVLRGDISIGISTSGVAPGCCRELRRLLDENLPPDAGETVRAIGLLRRKILAQGRRPAKDAEYAALIEKFARDLEYTLNSHTAWANKQEQNRQDL